MWLLSNTGIKPIFSQEKELSTDSSFSYCTGYFF